MITDKDMEEIYNGGKGLNYNKMINKEIDKQTAIIWIISAVLSMIGGILIGSRYF